ncbi:MAG: hypothetical protein ACI4HK_07050 [Ruminococcus sp.]
MKNFTRKVMAAALTAGVVASMAVTTAFADSNSVIETSSGIKNEFLEIKRDSDGDFTIHAITNAETGETTRLLYDMTSNLMLNVDGVNDEFYNNAANGVIEGDSIKDVDNTNDYVTCERSLKFIPNKINGNKNVVEVKFTATNTSSESHMVGGRIMLDTMLGRNDDAPFRIAGVGAVTKRMQFNGDEIPVMYQAFDDLENPTVVSTGYFASGSYKPDYVQFNNYWTSTDKYEPSCDTSSSLGDSVVNSIWKPVELAPGESKEFITYYGLGEIEITNGSLTLGAARTASSFEVEVNEDGNGYKPVFVTAYLKNSSTVDISNVQVSIEPSDGVTVADGDSTVTYDVMAPAGEEQKTWEINAEPSYTEKTVTVKISAKADDIDAIDPIEYTFTVPALAAPSQPTQPTQPTTVPATTVAPTTVPATTVAPTTVPATTVASATVQATTSAATPDQPKKQSTPDQTGKVATGDSRAPFALLATLLCAAGITAIISRKRVEK